MANHDRLRPRENDYKDVRDTDRRRPKEVSQQFKALVRTVTPIWECYTCRTLLPADVMVCKCGETLGRARAPEADHLHQVGVGVQTEPHVGAERVQHQGHCERCEHGHAVQEEVREPSQTVHKQEERLCHGRVHGWTERV